MNRPLTAAQTARAVTFFPMPRSGTRPVSVVVVPSSNGVHVQH